MVDLKQWVQEAGSDWHALRGTPPHYNTIEKYIQPVVDRYGWKRLREAWQTYLTVINKRQVSSEHFADNLGFFVGWTTERIDKYAKASRRFKLEEEDGVLPDDPTST